MAMDEAILEHVVRGESSPTLRLYRWEPPCLSLGRSQSFSDVDVAFLQQQGWDVVRRATGGRAILHADELTYAVIAAKDDPHVSGTLLDSYRYLANALVLALKYLGAQVKMQSRRNPVNATPVCFESPSMYEITANGKKLIGSAQARQKGGVLQHGSLPLTGDLTRITRALNFSDTQSRHIAAQKLLAHATTLESALGRKIAWEEASKTVIRAFEEMLKISLQPEGASPAELARAAELVSKKYANPQWTRRLVNQESRKTTLS
jgi:lipoate-protein ligase A